MDSPGSVRSNRPVSGNLDAARRRRVHVDASVLTDAGILADGASSQTARPRGRGGGLKGTRTQTQEWSGRSRAHAASACMAIT